MKYTVIITSCRESETIGKAVRQIIDPNKSLWRSMEVMVVAPDEETLNSAKNAADKFSNLVLLKDKAEGKPSALNLAFKKAKGEILILTDGDMYIRDNSVKDLTKPFNNRKIGGVSGRPVSLDSKKTVFGYYSHLFCDAAHKFRLKQTQNANAGNEWRGVSRYFPLSGYLYAIRKLDGINLPKEVKAEDAYLSYLLHSKGYKLAYTPKALAYVRFPKNLNDWINQKSRSVGGNTQLKAYFNIKNKDARSVIQDVKMFLFPIQYAKTPREFIYSILLYPLRLYLWIKIYTSDIETLEWKRVESSK